MPSQPDLNAFESKIGYSFKNRELLVTALTHPSYSRDNENCENNQRLEFLGDAILSALLAETLYNHFPKEREGFLTRNRASLAKGSELTKIAIEIGVPEYIRLSESEEKNQGRERKSIIEDCLEAVIGAIFLDSHYEQARSSVLAWIGDLDQRLAHALSAYNPKGQLQELVQSRHGNDAIRYDLKRAYGPPHDITFEVEVYIQEKIYGEGSGSTKKEAEENAARTALQRWAELSDKQ